MASKTKEKEKEDVRAWEKEDVEIRREGSQIVLPAKPREMSLRAAIKAIERRIRDEETEMDVHEIIDAYPMDGAVAFVKAMRRKYGWASPTPKMTFFGPMAPDLITVKVGPGPKDSVQVPWGMFTLPGIENPIGVSTTNTKSGPSFVIYGTVRKKEQHVLKELAELTREIVKNESIYKGKAIQLLANSDGKLKKDEHPDFIDVDRLVIRNLVLNPIEWDQVQCSLWAPIENTEKCVEHKIPLKRGVLLEGTYGTGKTMTAQATAKVCVDNEWTFILLDDVRALAEALQFAKRYEPAVVFAEDVDRIIQHRDDRGNDLLNTIDGVVSKNSKIITVLTTNHVEKLEQAMLRPGRLDAVISIRAPESEAVQRLLRIYGRKLIADNESLDNVGELLSGNIPATIREVVERSKLAMIHNGHANVTEKDLIIAAHGMTRHLELLAERPHEKKAPERLADALKEIVLPGSGQSEEQKKTVEEQKKLSNSMRNAAQAARTAAQMIEDASESGSRKITSAVTKVEKKVDKVQSDVTDIKDEII